jgi:hypothetical protein
MTAAANCVRIQRSEILRRRLIEHWLASPKNRQPFS